MTVNAGGREKTGLSGSPSLLELEWKMFASTGFSETYLAMKSEDMTKLCAALNVIRKEYSHISVGTLHAFLTAAEIGDELYIYKADMGSLAEEIQVPYSTLVRQLDLLGEGIGKRGGPKLIEKVAIPDVPKMKAPAVTASGADLIRQVAAAMATAKEDAITSAQSRIERLSSRFRKPRFRYQIDS